MITLDGLCNISAGASSTTTAPLRQACSLPRTLADKEALPVPHSEFGFDSSWEALFTGTDMADDAGILDHSL